MKTFLSRTSFGLNVSTMRLFVMAASFVLPMTAFAQCLPCDVFQGVPGYACDPTCEASICDADPFCCEDIWDQVCADAAAADPNCLECLTPPCPNPICPPDLTIEWPAGFNLNPVPPSTPQDPSIDPEVTGEPCPEAEYQDILFGPVVNTVTCSLGGVWLVERTWSDPTGSIICVQLFSYTDQTPPSFNCPPGGDLGWNPEEIPPPAELTATDECSGFIPVQVLQGDIVVFECLFSMTRTYQAVDDCGNVATCFQTFTWTVDNVAPTFDCPSGGYIGWNPDAFPPPEQLTASDFCSGDLPVTATIARQDTNECDGILVYEYRATDDCGNVTSCTQQFTYDVDIIPPTTHCEKPPPVVCPDFLPSPTVTAQMLIDDGNVTAWDNCDALPYFIGYTELEFGCSITRTFSYSSIDFCGNQGDTCSIIVQYYYDFEAPELTCTDDEHLGCNPDSIPTPQDLIDAGQVFADDNCGPASIGHIPPILGTRKWL